MTYVGTIHSFMPESRQYVHVSERGIGVNGLGCRDRYALGTWHSATLSPDGLNRVKYREGNNRATASASPNVCSPEFGGYRRGLLERAVVSQWASAHVERQAGGRRKNHVCIHNE